MPGQLDASPYRTSYVRRGIGVLIGGAPVLLLCASIVRSVTSGHRPSTPGLAVMLVASGIAVLNFYLSIIRGLSVRRTSGHISGIPFVGTVVVVIGTVLGFGSVVCAAIGLLAVVLDTGGSMWFLIATWKDRSFWDRAT